jgi:hypothetical protein
MWNVIFNHNFILFPTLCPKKTDEIQKDSRSSWRGRLNSGILLQDLYRTIRYKVDQNN